MMFTPKISVLAQKMGSGEPTRVRGFYWREGICHKRWISTEVRANNSCSVSPIKRHTTVKMNIFTFRWYLVFLIFLIRGLRRSEPSIFVCVTLDSNVYGTLRVPPLIDDNVTDACYYTMYQRITVIIALIIHAIITEICDIIIYKRGTVSVSNTMRGYRERW